MAVVVVGAYAGVGTFIICFIIDKLFGLKISPDKEEEGKHECLPNRINHVNKQSRLLRRVFLGLDITEHKEFAYHNLMLTGHELYDDLEEINDEAGTSLLFLIMRPA